MDKMTFEQWFAAVDKIVVRQFGLGVEDFPDQCWADWYEDGMSPAEAAEEMLANEGFDEDGPYFL